MNRRSVYAWEPRLYGAWRIHDYPGQLVAPAASRTNQGV